MSKLNQSLPLRKSNSERFAAIQSGETTPEFQAWSNLQARLEGIWIANLAIVETLDKAIAEGNQTDFQPITDACCTIAELAMNASVIAEAIEEGQPVPASLQ